MHVSHAPTPHSVCAVPQGGFPLHWPLVNSAHMAERLAKRELEKKRVEDVQQLALESPNHRWCRGGAGVVEGCRVQARRRAVVSRAWVLWLRGDPHRWCRLRGAAQGWL